MVAITRPKFSLYLRASNLNANGTSKIWYRRRWFCYFYVDLLNSIVAGKSVGCNGISQTFN